MEMILAKSDPHLAREYFERKMTFTLGPMEVHHKQQQHEKLIVVDVRAAKDFEKAHFPGAINLPEEHWESLRGLNKNLTHVVYCYSVVCHLAAKAAAYFAMRGFSVAEMEGGWEYWQHYKFEEETHKSLAS